MVSPRGITAETIQPQVGAMAKYQMSKTPITWDSKHQKSLETLVDRITSPPILAYPYFSSPFIVHTDTSQDGLGTALYQKQKSIL